MGALHSSTSNNKKADPLTALLNALRAWMAEVGTGSDVARQNRKHDRRVVVVVAISVSRVGRRLKR
jgi:hypothetical protein